MKLKGLKQNTGIRALKNMYAVEGGVLRFLGKCAYTYTFGLPVYINVHVVVVFLHPGEGGPKIRTDGYFIGGPCKIS
jgi:hypothetical protein